MKRKKDKINKNNYARKTKDSKNIVTKNMKFSKIIEKYPEAAGILFEEGMHCAGCSAAGFETLEEGCLMHGLDPDKIVEKINLKLNKKRKNDT